MTLNVDLSDAAVGTGQPATVPCLNPGCTNQRNPHGSPWCEACRERKARNLIPLVCFRPGCETPTHLYLFCSRACAWTFCEDAGLPTGEVGWENEQQRRRATR